MIPSPPPPHGGKRSLDADHDHQGAENEENGFRRHVASRASIRQPPLERMPVLLARPGPYDLPDDLSFEGLARPQGGEVIRLRFSRKSGTTVDLPLSAEALSALVQEVGLLHGQGPETIQAELSDPQEKGLGVLD